MMVTVVPFFEGVREKSEDEDLGVGWAFPTRCF